MNPPQYPSEVSPIFWKKEITMGQALGFSITILTLIFTGWMDMRITLAEHETRITTIEKNFEALNSTIKESNERQAANKDQIIQAINDLKLQLKDKKDRD